MQYKADNGKVVDTTTMEHVLDMDYAGCYGVVKCDVYRTKRTHNWYKVSESAWTGIRKAEAISLGEISILLAKKMEVGEIKDRYPEVCQYLKGG